MKSTAAKTIKNPHLEKAKRGLVVEVTAKKAGKGIVWSHVVNADKAPNGKINLPRDSGPFRIVYNLNDKTGMGLRFDAAMPFHCEATNGKCPTSIDRQQIMVESCDNNRLIVVDWNYGPKKVLHYQLNVTNRYGVPATPYDPVIVNGGGVRSGG